MRMGRHFAAAAAACLAFAATASGEVKTRVVDYTVSGTALQGMIAWDDAVKTPRPGVLVIHEWWGHNEHARTQARKLAEAGYVAFALDMFGKGKVTTHPKEAEAFMTEALKTSGAIGGAVQRRVGSAEERPSRRCERKWPRSATASAAASRSNIARAGADLDAVVALHANLSTAESRAAGQGEGADPRDERRSRSDDSARAERGVQEGNDRRGREVQPADTSRTRSTRSPIRTRAKPGCRRWITTRTPTISRSPR